MPTIEPSRPMVSASSSTELSTCRRVAPSVRSSASSRARWATVIENVLKIRNAPTSTAMNANASRPVVRNDRPSRMSSPAASASCAAVRTCAVGGRIEAMLRCSCVSETPDFAATNAKSTSLRLSNSACAVGRSNTTTVAPPSPDADPSVASPDELELLLRAAGRDRHRVADLEALLVRGRRVERDLARPARRLALGDPDRGERLGHVGRGDRRRAAGRDDLAVLAHHGGDVVDLPATWLTSGSALMSSSTWPSSGRGIVNSVSTASRPDTTTSAPLVCDVKISSNAFWIVSVRTNVPAIIVTPSRTAMTVSEVRSLRAASPRSARRVTPAPSSGRGSDRRRGGPRPRRCGRRRGRSRGRRPTRRPRRG